MDLWFFFFTFIYQIKAQPATAAVSQDFPTNQHRRSALVEPVPHCSRLETVCHSPYTHTIRTSRRRLLPFGRWITSCFDLLGALFSTTKIEVNNNLLLLLSTFTNTKLFFSRRYVGFPTNDLRCCCFLFCFL